MSTTSRCGFLSFVASVVPPGAVALESPFHVRKEQTGHTNYAGVVAGGLSGSETRSTDTGKAISLGHRHHEHQKLVDYLVIASSNLTQSEAPNLEYKRRTRCSVKTEEAHYSYGDNVLEPIDT
jgi:hypothetical protein